MHAEDSIVDERCHWKAVEAVDEKLPEFDVVASFTFIVEAVDTIDRGALMITPQKEEILWVFDFVGHE